MKTKICPGKHCKYEGFPQPIVNFTVTHQKTGRRKALCKPCRQLRDQEIKQQKLKSQQPKLNDFYGDHLPVSLNALSIRWTQRA